MAGSERYRLEASGITVEVDLGIGHLALIEIERDGRKTAPFHRAPWADDAVPPAGTEDAPHLARISGDFFCAPFGAADVEPSPSHGWPANAAWSLVDSRPVAGGGTTATFALEKPVMGARVLKELTLRDGHPFLYQRHIFEGGAGAVSGRQPRHGPAAARRAHCLFAKALGGDANDAAGRRSGARAIRSSPIPAARPTSPAIRAAMAAPSI